MERRESQSAQDRRPAQPSKRKKFWTRGMPAITLAATLSGVGAYKAVDAVVGGIKGIIFDDCVPVDQARLTTGGVWPLVEESRAERNSYDKDIRSDVDCTTKNNTLKPGHKIIIYEAN